MGIHSELRFDEERSEIQVVAGARPPLLTGSLRIPETKRFTLVTPESNVGQIFLAREGGSWILGLSELQVGCALQSSQLNQAMIAVKKVLPQAPLCPAVLHGVEALPSCVRIEFPDLTVRSEIRPIPSTSSELLEMLVEEYRAVCENETQIGVLVSAGWDSRLELACVLAAIGRKRAKQVELLHICTRADELNVVKNLSRDLGCKLNVRDISGLVREWGPSNAGEMTPSLSALAHLPTWRPSIPQYSKLVTWAKSSRRIGTVIGYAPHSLKGRQYGIKFDPNMPPSDGLFRLIRPNTMHGEILSESEIVDPQVKTWKKLTQLSRDWDQFAQRDFLLWQLHNGNSYAHRLWPWLGVDVVTVNHRPDVVARFMGLAPDEKVGTTFVEYALTRLSQDMLRSGVISSTGERGLTESSQGDRKKELLVNWGRRPIEELLLQMNNSGLDSKGLPASVRLVDVQLKLFEDKLNQKGAG